MNNRLLRSVILLSLFLLLILPFCNALTISLIPSKVRINSAVKGNEYTQQIFISTLSNEELSIQLNATGEIASWVRFYDSDISKEITSISVPAGGSKNFQVIFTIPQDAANGKHSGMLVAGLAPKNLSNASGASVSLLTTSIVTLNVTGEQRLEGRVGGIEINNVESGQPLRIVVDFTNTGNVKAKPEFKVTISKNGKIVDIFSYNEIIMDVGTSKLITTEWDTEGRGAGNMTADVLVLLDGKVISQKDLAFNIAPKGTLSAVGRVGNIQNPRSYTLNTPAKMQIDFYNKGLIDFKAKIVGEVYRDGTLVDTITGEETAITVGEKQTLTAFVKPNSYGNYVVKRSIVFEGKTMNATDLIFKLSKVPGTGANTGPSLAAGQDEGISTTGIIILVVIVLIIGGAMIGAGVFIARKFSRKPKRRKRR